MLCKVVVVMRSALAEPISRTERSTSREYSSFSHPTGESGELRVKQAGGLLSGEEPAHLASIQSRFNALS
jgi:hypothetical protein